MWYLATFDKTLFRTSIKGGDIAGAHYLKVKNDFTHWKTIIPDKSQIHAAPNFLLLSSYIASPRCNNMLNSAAPDYKW